MPIYFQIITYFRLDYNIFDKVHFVSHIFIKCNANISYEMTFYHCTSIVSSYVKVMLTLVLLDCGLWNVQIKGISLIPGWVKGCLTNIFCITAQNILAIPGKYCIA